MLAAWTVILPHFVFAWFARRHCEIIDQSAPIGPFVQARPGVLLRMKRPSTDRMAVGE